MMSRRLSLFLVLVAGLCLTSSPAIACAACFGKSDAALAKGMNWGIFSLLFIIVAVLGTLASFFVYLARRAASVSAREASDVLAPGTDATLCLESSAPRS